MLKQLLFGSISGVATALLIGACELHARLALQGSSADLAFRQITVGAPMFPWLEFAVLLIGAAMAYWVGVARWRGPVSAWAFLVGMGLVVATGLIQVPLGDPQTMEVGRSMLRGWLEFASRSSATITAFGLTLARAVASTIEARRALSERVLPQAVSAG